RVHVVHRDYCATRVDIPGSLAAPAMFTPEGRGYSPSADHTHVSPCRLRPEPTRNCRHASLREVGRYSARSSRAGVSALAHSTATAIIAFSTLRPNTRQLSTKSTTRHASSCHSALSRPTRP